MMFDLSVCIPTYKRPKFLSETMNSVLKQQNYKVEIVISDNGSNDTTKKVISDYQEVFQNINSFGFPVNEGIDKNILNLAEKANGKYIFFVSDDDIVLPGTICAILRVISKFEPNVIYLNHFPFFEGLKNTRPSFLPRKNLFFRDGEKFFKYAGLGFLSSLILNRELALKYRDSIVYGHECAHLDLSSRVALNEKGSFIFLGTISVAARATPDLRYDPFDSCIFNQKKLFDKLKSEKILSAKSYRFLSRRLLLKDFLKIFLRASVNDLKKKALYTEVTREFSDNRISLRILKLIFCLKNKHKSLVYKLLKTIFKKFLWLKKLLTA